MSGVLITDLMREIWSENMLWSNLLSNRVSDANHKADTYEME